MCPPNPLSLKSQTLLCSLCCFPAPMWLEALAGGAVAHGQVRAGKCWEPAALASHPTPYTVSVGQLTAVTRRAQSHSPSEAHSTLPGMYFPTYPRFPASLQAAWWARVESFATVSCTLSSYNQDFALLNIFI